MATKVVYFTVDGKPEQAEFRSDDTADELKDTFRAAAEANSDDILKLYNTKGNLINISPKLPENTPDTRYKLEVVALHCNGFPYYMMQIDNVLATQFGVVIKDLESRIEMLEKKVFVENGEIPPVVGELKHKVEHLREKLEGVDHLSWLGLFKDISCGTSLKPFWDKTQSIKKTEEHNRMVFEKFKKISQVQVTDEVREYLRKPTFDNWQWDDPEMIILLRQMYIDLDLVSKFNIEMNVLHQWLYEIYKNYNQVPFHNFKHCFMVAQMMYGLTWLIDLRSVLDDVDIFILLTSAICHDLDHPGYNNAYQINAKTELALRYNDISPLENHHCFVAFEILQKSHCNILRNVSKEDYKRIREGMIRCILATDMAKHNEILNNFKSVMKNFDFKSQEHKSLLMMILMKVADISNEARPLGVAEPWLDCLLSEFFNQSDMEKLEGLPVAPFMDRDKVTKSSSQIGFIKFALLPLFEALRELFPVIEKDIIQPVRAALEYYTDMQKALEEEKKKGREAAKQRMDKDVIKSKIQT
ncbi:high affinity cGMP-specific 3',5'-cyclic phosphodiesterase 9A isoform X2 [Magallana gigas]|uniref:high affinity cGMP-specific 3',5'-cyclic phosphodiesterase 9A isoform X2 n=1 Tax=Magallana gigas TaxID=29159 RepID=UPI0005C3A74B|nr:high affinity cGMP-specific 3',5'-cyclic phosphodiesterase 9A isoform X4 [Crassostrea gigas]|eukprot:XP_011418592.1 PREDICTED: high affinity cGMP-specific 3',5'-cyclic phosphodiesterase 9A isoform X2 [Crassostrea gigas]